MHLRNTREPFDELEELHPDRIKHLLSHGYVEVKSEPFGQMTIRRGRKADQPPADLGELVDDVSKDKDIEE